MVSYVSYKRLGSEAGCLFSCLNLSGTAEFEFQLWQHSDEIYPDEVVPVGGVLAVTCLD